jgi:hypothetical protein
MTLLDQRFRFSAFDFSYHMVNVARIDPKGAPVVGGIVRALLRATHTHTHTQRRSESKGRHCIGKSTPLSMHRQNGRDGRWLHPAVPA